MTDNLPVAPWLTPQDDGGDKLPVAPWLQKPAETKPPAPPTFGGEQLKAAQRGPLEGLDVARAAGMGPIGLAEKFGYQPVAAAANFLKRDTLPSHLLPSMSDEISKIAPRFKSYEQSIAPDESAPWWMRYPAGVTEAVTNPATWVGPGSALLKGTLGTLGGLFSQAGHDVGAGPFGGYVLPALIGARAGLARATRGTRFNPLEGEIIPPERQRPPRPPPGPEPMEGEVIPPDQPPPPPPPAPFYATPREGLGIDLLPHDAPHRLPARAGVGATGTPGYGPLTGVSPAVIQRMREHLAAEGYTQDEVGRNLLEQRIGEMSQHQFLGELTPGMENRLGGLGTFSGASRSEIANSLHQRSREAPQRMLSLFNRTVGDYQNMRDLQHSMDVERGRVASPLYDAFRALPIPPTQALQGLTPRLNSVSAFSNARALAEAEGIPWQEGFMPESGIEQQTPTGQTWDLVKRSLDRQIEQSMRAGDRTWVRVLTRMKNDLINALNDHPDQRIGEAYQRARAAYAGPSELLTAQELGRQLLSNDIHPEDLPYLTENWRDAQRRNLLIGLRADLEDAAASSRSPARTTNKLLDKVLPPSNQRKLRAVLGDEQADELIEGAQHEETMHGAPTRLIHGSATGARTTAREEFEHEPTWLQTLKPSDAPHGPIHAVSMGIAKGIEAAQQRSIAKSEEGAARFRDELARINMLQGRERDEALRQLLGSPRGGPEELPGRETPPELPDRFEEEPNAFEQPPSLVDKRPSGLTKRYEKASEKSANKFVDLGPFPQRPGREDLGKQAQRYVTARGMASGVEHLVAVDEDGDILAHGHGDSSRVGAEPELVHALRDPDRSVVIHHNHPSNSALSAGDYSMLGYPGLSAMWAHGHGGAVYRASLNPQARDLWSLDPAGTLDPGSKILNLRRNLMNAHTAARDALYPPLAVAVREGKISRDDANALIQAATSEVMDRAGIVDYRSNVETAPTIARLGMEDHIETAARDAARRFYGIADPDATYGYNDRSAEPLRHAGELGASFDPAPIAPDEYAATPAVYQQRRANAGRQARQPRQLDLFREGEDEYGPPTEREDAARSYDDEARFYAQRAEQALPGSREKRSAERNQQRAERMAAQARNDEANRRYYAPEIERYKQARERGEPDPYPDYPDDLITQQGWAEDKPAFPPPRRAGMGHNQPPEPMEQDLNRPVPKKVPGVGGHENPLPIPEDYEAGLARMDKRRGKDVGGVNNDAVRLGKNIWVGDVNLPQWKQRTAQILSPGEITEARRWYRDALSTYEKYFGPEKGAAMLGAWLMANQNVSPSGAVLNAVRPLEQYLNKTEGSKQGGLSHDKVFQWWDAILSGDMTKLRQAGSGQKIYDFIDSALQKNTRTFYGDDPKAGAPAVADVHSLRDMGFVDNALINWVRETYGDKAADALKIDSQHLSPGEAQYEWAADKMRKFTDQLNKQNWMGGNWNPAELQAVGWTAMSKLLGRKAETPGAGIESQIRNLSYELDFGAGAPYHQQFPEWANLSGAQKAAVSKAVLPHIVDFAKQNAGATEYQRIFGTGGWRQYTNPAYKSRLIASPEVAGDVADMIGYLGQQTEVFGYRWLGGGSRLGVAVHGPALKNPSTVTKFWNGVVKEIPELAHGFSPTIRSDGVHGIEILLDKGTREAHIAQKLVPALDKVATDLGIAADMHDFRADVESRAHDWTKDQEGGDYLSRLRARYGPAISERLELFKREKLEPAIRREIARAIAQGARQRAKKPGPEVKGFARGGAVHARAPPTFTLTPTVSRLLREARA